MNMDPFVDAFEQLHKALTKCIQLIEELHARMLLRFVLAEQRRLTARFRQPVPSLQLLTYRALSASDMSTLRQWRLQHDIQLQREAPIDFCSLLIQKKIESVTTGSAPADGHQWRHRGS